MSFQDFRILYVTIEAPNCFDSYNQLRLGGGRSFNMGTLTVKYGDCNKYFSN